MDKSGGPSRPIAPNLFWLISSHRYFLNTVIMLILFNAVLLGMETVPEWYTTYFFWFHFLDQLLLWIFTVEIIIRMLAVRPTLHFFKDGWNIFDFIIVSSGHILVGAQFVTVLRILRMIRVLRAFSAIPSLRRMVAALMMTIPALGNILLLMGFIFYIFGISGTMLFAHASPEYFGSLSSTLLTLFQVVTLESWASGVMRPLLLEVPWAWIYFVLFVLMGTFVLFNLFVGAIVNNMDKADAEETEQEAQTEKPNLQTEIHDLKAEIHDLKAEIQELKQMLIAMQPSDRNKIQLPHETNKNI